MSYHYTECGLDNVYLENGYTVHKTAHGDGVSIKDIYGLHKAIGSLIVAAPRRINGAELRFLRTELDLSQKRLADLIDTDEQNVRRWERFRTRPISSGPADRLARALYSECMKGDGSLMRLVERIAELDVQERVDMRMRQMGDRHWSSAQAA